MPSVPVTIDPIERRIYAGTPANPDGELPTVNIGGDTYALSPTGSYLISETAPAIQIGRTGPTIVNYASYGEYQLSTPIATASVNRPGVSRSQRAFSGTVQTVLPTGDAVQLPVEGVVLIPENTRLAYTFDMEGKGTSVYVNANLRTVDELRGFLNDPLARYARPLEVLEHGLIKHLYQNESALVKEVYESHVMDEVGLPDTYSGAAAWLLQQADFSQGQVFSQRFSR